MRIGLDASPLRAGGSPGVRRAVVGWLGALAEVAGEDDHVVAFVPGPLDGGGEAPGGRVERVGVGPKTTDPRVVRREARRLVERHRIDVWLSPWTAFPRIAVPVVVTVHEVPWVRWGPIEGRLRTWVHGRWLERASRRAATLVVPAEAVREDVARILPAAGARSHVVPHAFDPDPWARARPEVPPSVTPPYGIAVGATGLRKGGDVLVAVRRALAGGPPNWVLAVRAAGPRVAWGNDARATPSLETRITQGLCRKHRLPFVDLSRSRISAEIVDLVPKKIVQDFNVVPVTVRDEKLLLAADDPAITSVADDLRRALERDFELALTPPSALRRIQAEAYGIGEPSQAEAIEPPQPDRVHVAMDPSDETLARWIAGAAFLVQPSRSEGFGFPALEAMAAGVPVLSTTGGAIPEVCGDAALLVPPEDPEALADGVRRLLSDAALRADLVAKGRVRARAFPPRACGERLLAVLRLAAAKGGP